MLLKVEGVEMRGRGEPSHSPPERCAFSAASAKIGMWQQRVLRIAIVPHLTTLGYSHIPSWSYKHHIQTFPSSHPAALSPFSTFSLPWEVEAEEGS